MCTARFGAWGCAWKRCRQGRGEAPGLADQHSEARAGPTHPLLKVEVRSLLLGLCSAVPISPQLLPAVANTCPDQQRVEEAAHMSFTKAGGKWTAGSVLLRYR